MFAMALRWLSALLLSPLRAPKGSGSGDMMRMSSGRVESVSSPTNQAVGVCSAEQAASSGARYVGLIQIETDVPIGAHYSAGFGFRVGRLFAPNGRELKQLGLIKLKTLNSSFSRLRERYESEFIKCKTDLVCRRAFSLINYVRASPVRALEPSARWAELGALSLSFSLCLRDKSR